MAASSPVVMSKVIGLCGGIASGKTTVSRVLKESCGAAVIDADVLGHESYAPGENCHTRILSTFGPQVAAPDGTIDRRALGGIVFADPEKKKLLESIVWPEIRTLAESRIEKYKQEQKELIVLEAAIMLEANWQTMVDEVWVVSVEPDIAISRIMARNGLTEEQAKLRLAAQASNAEREAKADVVVRNSGTPEDLEKTVREIWEKRRPVKN